MTEAEYLKYTEELSVRGSVYGTECMQALMNKLGNIQDTLKVIHVAGTNGKGSTIAFVFGILRAAGYKTGRYTSPVVIEANEQYQIGGSKISKKDLYECMSVVKAAADELENETSYRPTLFEIQTAVAFVWFAKKKCDFVVLETGLGGRDDATNVLKKPLVSVLTSISRDHMSILGNTVAEIAKVKCGIVKAGSRLVVAKQSDETVNQAIACYCEDNELGVTPVFTGNATAIHSSLKGQTFSYGTLKKLKINMAGDWQISNACTAVEVINQLEKLGYKISEAKLRSGLEDTVWPGRFTNIGDSKVPFIIDGAHNEDAAVWLRRTVDSVLDGRRLVYIMGMFSDKEYEKVVAIMADRADYIITVATPDNPRALSALELASVVSKYNTNVTAADSVEEAAEMALLLNDKISQETSEKTGILAFGSLSYLGRLAKYMDGEGKQWKKIKA